MKDIFHSFFVCDIIWDPLPGKEFQIAFLGKAFIQQKDHAFVLRGAYHSAASLKYFVDAGIEIGIMEAAAFVYIIIALE